MGRRVYIDNAPLEETLKSVVARWKELESMQVKSESIDVAESRGRITAEPVRAEKSSPHYPASAMDGIAVLSSDTAGANETAPVALKRSRQFAEVDTGDPVPPEFDSVIMIEDVNFMDDGSARIIAPAVPWQHVRSVGEDLIASQMIVPTAFPIGPYEIGAMLTAGVKRVKVARQPRVAIIPTGTEIVEPGKETMIPGEITESNSRMLGGLCEEWGALPIRCDIVVDDWNLLRKAVEQALEIADIVVVCSGSSAGREDYTAGVIAELGELLMHGLAVRPGKPAIAGIIKGKPVLGVPGYPVSAALIFELLGRPLVYGALGQGLPLPDTLEARLARKLPSHMGVDEFVHVSLAPAQGGYLAFPRNRGAGATSSLVQSDGVIVIPRGLEGFQPGEKVSVKLNRSRGIIDRTLLAIGSHDLALDYLGNLLWQKYGWRLASTNVGSMGGIMALKRHETHLAGIHLLDTGSGEYNVSYLKRYLPGENMQLINLVMREQGLMVQSGNPLGIRGLGDLVQPGVRFVNRQKGSGTRILLDYLLTEQGLDRSDINGYEREEFSHLSVAAAVENRNADAALGIYAGARALGLDFVPVVQERYDICVAMDMINEDALEALRAVIADPDFQRDIAAFGGYDLEKTGQVMWISDKS